MIVLSGAISLMGGYGFYAVIYPIAGTIGFVAAWIILQARFPETGHSTVSGEAGRSG